MVVVAAALAEPPDPGLDPALREAVAGAAGAWALAVAGHPARVIVADAPAHALPALLHTVPGRVVLVAPDVPRLDDALAEAVLGDLAAGCALTIAPATDGRPFLLAIAPVARAHVLSRLASGDRHRDALFTEVSVLGEVGLLRSERRLISPADARALVADPLAPAALRELAAVAMRDS